MTVDEADALLADFMAALGSGTLGVAWMVAHCPRGTELGEAWALATNDGLMWDLACWMRRAPLESNGCYCADCEWPKAANGRAMGREQVPSRQVRPHGGCADCAAIIRAAVPTIALPERGAGASPRVAP